MTRTAVRRASAMLAYVCTALLVTGCGLLNDDPDTVAPTGGPFLSTQKTYTIETRAPDERGVRVVIPFQYTNETDSPLYFPGCIAPEPPRLERRAEDGTWTFFYQPALPECIGEPYRLDPSEMLRDTLVVDASISGERSQTLSPPLTGTFRLQIRVADERRGDLLPAEKRTSNTFEMVARN